MSEAVSSNHDPDSRLPKATRTAKMPVAQEDLTPQRSGNVASGESLHQAMRETLAPLSVGLPLEMADWHPVEFPDAMSLAKLSHTGHSHTGQSVSESTQSSVLNSAVSSSEDPQSENLQSEDPQSDVRNLVDRLQQENSTFRAQVGQLERDLAQAQVELQLEVTRFYCKESEVAAAPSVLKSEELSSIYQQISQLSQELDLSQKLGHRQQILVETLSEQLESGQERIAHLERDCAITQQRYNEQVQLVLQAENVCRDLRMRLHRQQRQALQFKAALEKSLEMGSVPEGAIAPSDLISPIASDSATPFIPKVQPVQPWSQGGSADSRAYANCRGEEHGLLNLFSKLLMADQQPIEGVDITPIQEVEFASIQVSSMVSHGRQSAEGNAGSVPISAPPHAPLGVITSDDVSQSMSLLFPRQAESEPQSFAVEPAADSAVFDLSPFLEAGEAAVMKAPALELRAIAKNVLPPLLHPPRPKKSAAHQKPSAATADSQPHALSQSGDREDNLWADLAKLIEPDSTVESAATSDLLNQAVERSPVPSNPFQHAANLASDAMVEDAGLSDETTVTKNNKSDRASTAKPLSLDFFAYIEKKATNPPNTNPPNIKAVNPASHSEPTPKTAPDPTNANLSQFGKKIEKKTVAPEETVESSPSLPQTSDTSRNACPSPILYPFRPAKKLNSMSAVDLPSFRHAAH